MDEERTCPVHGDACRPSYQVAPEPDEAAALAELKAQAKPAPDTVEIDGDRSPEEKAQIAELQAAIREKLANGGN